MFPRFILIVLVKVQLFYFFNMSWHIYLLEHFLSILDQKIWASSVFIFKTISHPWVFHRIILWSISEDSIDNYIYFFLSNPYIGVYLKWCERYNKMKISSQLVLSGSLMNLISLLERSLEPQMQQQQQIQLPDQQPPCEWGPVMGSGYLLALGVAAD